MICFSARSAYVGAIAVAALFSLTASEKLVAASPDVAPNVTYTATGVFASPQVSGGDVFKLAGEAFSITVVANAAAVPTSHGSNWAKFTSLPMTGTISTGLTPTPYSIKSKMTSVQLALGNPNYQLFVLFAPVSVVNTPIYVTANIQMPLGTLAKPLNHPFAPITLGPADTVIYTDPATGASTTLTIASGTLQGTIPGGGVNREDAEVSGVQLHANGAQVIQSHADGTRSVHSIGTMPVEVGESSDTVALRFFASGVREGADVHVQIAGHDVPLLYAGPAGHFPGLDEVDVTVPRSLAGSGNVDVSLMVDGHTANPVHIQIQ
jgi:uncharacterized protein (TIGR03437 family)